MEELMKRALAKVEQVNLTTEEKEKLEDRINGEHKTTINAVLNTASNQLAEKLRAFLQRQTQGLSEEQVIAICKKSMKQESILEANIYIWRRLGFYPFSMVHGLTLQSFDRQGKEQGMAEQAITPYLSDVKTTPQSHWTERVSLGGSLTLSILFMLDRAHTVLFAHVTPGAIAFVVMMVIMVIRWLRQNQLNFAVNVILCVLLQLALVAALAILALFLPQGSINAPVGRKGGN